MDVFDERTRKRRYDVNFLVMTATGWFMVEVGKREKMMDFEIHGL